MLNTENELSEHSVALKRRLKEADEKQQELLYQAFMTALVAQEELLTRSAAQLRTVIDSLPADYQSITGSIQEHLAIKVHTFSVSSFLSFSYFRRFLSLCSFFSFLPFLSFLFTTYGLIIMHCPL